MTIDWMRRMRDAGLPAEQAEAVASMPEERYVTREYYDAGRLADRDYLEARLEAVRREVVDTLTMRMLGIAGLIVILVGLLDKFVRP